MAAAEFRHVAAKDHRGRVVLAGVGGLVTKDCVGRLLDGGRFLIVRPVARLMAEHDHRLAGDVHAGKVVVVGLAGGNTVAGKDQGKIEFAISR